MKDGFAYELIARSRVRHQVEDRRASILYCEGTMHFVDRESVAERDLLERGGLHVGVVRFDLPERSIAFASGGAARGLEHTLWFGWGSLGN